MASAADNQPQFLYLATSGWKTGRRHQIEIWFVEHGGRYYAMSEHKERSHWVQNIAHNPRVSFSVGGRKFEGTARAIRHEEEPELAREVAGLMDSKYRWDGGLIVELKPDNDDDGARP